MLKSTMSDNRILQPSAITIVPSVADIFLTLPKTSIIAPPSICSLFGRVYAISVCHSLGKIKTQKNPAIKGWITEDKKMVDHFYLIRKILPSSNVCKLVKNGHRFVISRKHLCFQHFLKTEKNFPLNRKDFFSETTANCPDKRC